MRSEELGESIRACRDRLVPVEAGFSSGTRGAPQVLAAADLRLVGVVGLQGMAG